MCTCIVYARQHASAAGTCETAMTSSRVAMRGAGGPGGTHSTTARAAPVLMAAMCSGAATTLRCRALIALSERRGTLKRAQHAHDCQTLIRRQ